MCVFDTVGSLGLPEELTLGQHKMNFIFGFPDKTLGEHVENAFHALALNETRADFVGFPFLSGYSKLIRLCVGLRKI